MSPARHAYGEVVRLLEAALEKLDRAPEPADDRDDAEAYGALTSCAAVYRRLLARALAEEVKADEAARKYITPF